MAEGRESQGDKSRSRCGDHTNKKEHEMCCFFEARHQERERRQCSAHRREQCLVLFALCKSPGNAAWASPSSVPPSPSPSSIVAHPRCVCLLALRSLRLREKFDATWREGYAGISGTRRRYACNSSCRRTSPWSAAETERRYHQRPKDGEGKRRLHYYCILEPKEDRNHGRSRDSSEDRRDR